MALATGITDAGNLISSSKPERRFSKWTDFTGVVWYVETSEEEVREWVALTQAAAEAAVAAGSGEAYMGVSGTGTTYEHDCFETQRQVGAYTYRCSAQKKSIAVA
jgi:hypothetical protein